MNKHEEKIYKERTKGTIYEIINRLSSIDSTELVTELFVITDNNIALKMIKRFEAVLIKAKLKPQYLHNNLHKFYIKTNKYLKNNNLYKEFTKFSYFIYSNLSNKNINTNVLSAYQNLVLQQLCYIAPPGKIIYGITKNGIPMIMDEVYPAIDYVFYDLEKKKNVSKEDLLEGLKKYGYNVSSYREFEQMMYDEMVITNMVLAMCSFINEGTLDIVPEKFFLPSQGITVVREWKSTDYYRSLLKKRKYILPVNGVKGVYKNAGSIHNIFFKELFMDNQVYLLYKINNSYNEGIYGVYDTKNDFFYSIYRDSNREDYHNFIENFVLESYCHLTTDIEIDRKRNMGLKIVDNIEEVDFHYPNQPVVEFLYPEETTHKEFKDKAFRKYDKRKYKQQTIAINPFIRKLPAGAKASDEAIERAKAFGYKLAEDETFVRPFTRKSFVLKE